MEINQKIKVAVADFDKDFADGLCLYLRQSAKIDVVGCELEAFTQFGSDLDAATQAKLNRGRRTIEVLKQPLHKPLPVEKQVVILYALTHGFLDSVPVDQILDFEEALYDYFDSHHEDIFEIIRTTKDLPEESVLNEAIQAFKDQSEYK